MMESGISLVIVSLFTMIGVIRCADSNNKHQVKIFEPTTLLTASSLLCARDAVTLTAVSGRDVPIATIVSPIMIDGTFSLRAILELPSTKSLLLLSETQIQSQEIPAPVQMVTD